MNLSPLERSRLHRAARRAKSAMQAMFLFGFLLGIAGFIAPDRTMKHPSRLWAAALVAVSAFNFCMISTVNTKETDDAS